LTSEADRNQLFEDFMKWMKVARPIAGITAGQNGLGSPPAPVTVPDTRTASNMMRETTDVKVS